MTCAEAVAGCLRRRPGSKVTESDLLPALGEIEGRVWARVWEPRGLAAPSPADVCVPDRELSVPDPFSRLYIHWLCAASDLIHGDTAAYNREITLCGSVLDEYESAVTRGVVCAVPAAKYW